MRFAFASVVVSDIAQARDWYRDVLGFKVDSFSKKWGWCEVRPPRANVKISLLEPYEEPKGSSRRGGGSASARARKDWGDIAPKIKRRLGTYTGLVFHVDDLDKEVERLQRLGVTFTRRAKAEPWGGSEAMFEDPDGNEFHLVEAA